ncbi:peroxiredoxin family protein [Niallia sp. 01092]|uniref:peroxiredoxin family protein n=1 Tax=unclassified Niallia TaxID=2837522 RepID=UPI003FD5F99F
MLKKIMCSVVLTLIFCSSDTLAAQNEAQELEIGAKAPDFSLKNLAGDTVKLSDYRGKKVMLNFWATWCPPCKQEMPTIQQFFKESGNKVVILAVNIDGTEDVVDFVNNRHLTFPILLDEKDKVNELYKIITIPTTFFIDENGVIKQKYYSAMPITIMREYSK